MAEVTKIIPIETEELIDCALQSFVYDQIKVIQELEMAKGYLEMAEINLRLSELCFAAESEVEQFLEQRIAECE